MDFVNRSYQEKVAHLKRILEESLKEDLVLAFSGGVDSALLLKMSCEAAKQYGTKVYGITVHSKLHPAGDLEIARRVCEESGGIHVVLYADELMEAGIIDNPVDRCYLCKKCILQKIGMFAKEKGIHTIIEGSNEDDLHVYRPGLRALKESGILSPLAQCGMVKKEVRRLAEEYGISVAKRPSTPCMATRFPYGDHLDYDKLHAVEVGEKWLSSQGFYNVRLRVHSNIARIEVDSEDFPKILEKKENIIEKIKELGFDYVTLDLEGFRSGSMDIHIK